jgi:hypothetical protein
MRKICDRIFCSIVRTWLLPRAEGSVVPVPAVFLNWINSHIDYCKRCSHELKHLRLAAFTIRKAASRGQGRQFDPYFADRVIQRVKREEIARRRHARQLRLVYAASAVGALMGAAVIGLGGFNFVAAHLFGPVTPSPVPIKVVAPPVTYTNSDPFVMKGENGNVSYNGFANISGSGNTKVIKAAPAPVKPPVQDYLSRLMQNHPVDVATRTVLIPSQPPALVASSYQVQDRTTPPAIIGSASAGIAPAIVMPAPSAPGSPPVQGSDAQAQAANTSSDINAVSAAAPVTSGQIVPMRTPIPAYGQGAEPNNPNSNSQITK